MWVRFLQAGPKFLCPVTLIGSADSLKRSWLSVRIRHGVPHPVVNSIMFYKDITLKKVNWNLNFNIPINLSRKLYEQHYHNVNDIVPNDLLKKLDSVGLSPLKVRLFVWPKNHIGIWHIDGRHWSDDTHLASIQNVSLNWVLAGSGVIQWDRRVESKLKTIDGVYRGLQSSLDDSFEAESAGDGVLVDTTIPHRVLTGPAGRTSITLQWKTNENDFKFPVMVEKLKSIGLTI